jgi:hypothetical protein
MPDACFQPTFDLVIVCAKSNSGYGSTFSFPFQHYRNPGETPASFKTLNLVYMQRNEG